MSITSGEGDRDIVHEHRRRSRARLRSHARYYAPSQYQVQLLTQARPERRAQAVNAQMLSAA